MAHLPRLTEDGDVSYVDEAGRTHANDTILSYRTASGNVQEVTQVYGLPIVAGDALVDGVTSAVKVIDYAHHEVHDGHIFAVHDTVACDTTTVKWQVTTPNTTRYSHMVFDLSCTGEALYLVTEGSDRTDGTALAEVNRRRVGTPNVAGTIVTRTPTDGATDGALVLFTERNGITNVAGKTLASGAARSNSEWILKPNTKYVVSVTTYAAVYVTCALNWYEHSEA
jgi:hypothetical protein